MKLSNIKSKIWAEKNYCAFYEQCLSVMKLLIHVSKCKMESYCLKCRKDTKNIDPEISSTSNGRAMILSKCAICGSKNPDLLKIKKQKDYQVN